MTSYFRAGSGVFACRHCKRKTRDVGDNGDTGLCADCYDGCGWDNAIQSAEDPERAARYTANRDECFEAAVRKGGKIEGYPRA
jgi:hypothetical protein